MAMVEVRCSRTDRYNCEMNATVRRERMKRSQEVEDVSERYLGATRTTKSRAAILAYPGANCQHSLWFYR
jgi:hypothetical protein